MTERSRRRWRRLTAAVLDAQETAIPDQTPCRRCHWPEWQHVPGGMGEGHEFEAPG